MRDQRINRYAVIMAGGVGSRFWPLSREHMPKQLLSIFGAGSMLQNTVKRITPLIPHERILIVSNSKYIDEIKAQLPEIPIENIIVEPVGRNTAPCIGLAAAWLKKKDPDSQMAVLPADHLILKQVEFLDLLEGAFQIAEKTNAVGTIGITPTHPETGYGYIQVSTPIQGNIPSVFQVKTFAEKPNLETAQRFIDSGEFYWNSGMFVWNTNTILEQIKLYLPELFEHIERIAEVIGTQRYSEVLEQAFGLIRSISIDYGVMEKSDRVFMVVGDIGWSDVGSWDEVAKLSKVFGNGDENIAAGMTEFFYKDSANNYINAPDQFVSVIGAENLIIVSSKDSLLICKKGRSQEVKEVVDFLRRKELNKFI